jgi:hypothetical protein
MECRTCGEVIHPDNLQPDIWLDRSQDPVCQFEEDNVIPHLPIC